MAKNDGGKKSGKRSMVVFVGLVGVLTGTSALLLAVAPAPLSPDAGGSRGNVAAMSAGQRQIPIPGLLDTRVPVQPGRWEYIYVRHAKSSADPRLLTGDHFIVTGGDGNAAGQIRMTLRWQHQSSATPPPGAKEIHPKCVSVVLGGDLDTDPPTAAQFRAVNQLVRTLQAELNIPADRVLLVDARDSAAGTGRLFPTAAFRENLAP